MYPVAPDLTGRETALIIPMADPEFDHVGFDPRSHYAETFWLPILGPSTLWLLRNIAQRFDAEPEGFSLDLEEASNCHMAFMTKDHYVPFDIFNVAYKKQVESWGPPRPRRRDEKLVQIAGG